MRLIQKLFLDEFERLAARYNVATASGANLDRLAELIPGRRIPIRGPFAGPKVRPNITIYSTTIEGAVTF